MLRFIIFLLVKKNRIIKAAYVNSKLVIDENAC